MVTASTNTEVDGHIPNYPNLLPQLICQLHNVTMHADVETDEVYAQMTLQPLTQQEQKDTYLPADLGLPSKQPTNYFCKTLTASDTSTHGGFSVPRRAAEKVFPPLVRIWNEKNQLLLGIRRASRPQTVMPSSVLSSDSMQIGLLVAAAHDAVTNSRFTIFYNPRASPSEFVIPLLKYVKAVFHTRVSVGMRFRILFETEESSVRRNWLKSGFHVFHLCPRLGSVGANQNSADELYNLFGHFGDHFHATSRNLLYMNFISSNSNNIYALEQLRSNKTKASSFTLFVKMMTSLPFSCQSQSPSPYFDQSLFRFDEKLISATNRHMQSTEHPIPIICQSNGKGNMQKTYFSCLCAVEIRRALHSRLGFPLDHPLLRIVNALDVSTGDISAGSNSTKNVLYLLKDVHTGVPRSGGLGMCLSISSNYHFMV